MSYWNSNSNCSFRIRKDYCKLLLSYVGKNNNSFIIFPPRYRFGSNQSNFEISTVKIARTPIPKYLNSCKILHQINTNYSFEYTQQYESETAVLSPLPLCWTVLNDNSWSGNQKMLSSSTIINTSLFSFSSKQRIHNKLWCCLLLLKINSFQDDLLSRYHRYFQWFTFLFCEFQKILLFYSKQCTFLTIGSTLTVVALYLSSFRSKLFDFHIRALWFSHQCSLIFTSKHFDFRTKALWLFDHYLAKSDILCHFLKFLFGFPSVFLFLPRLQCSTIKKNPQHFQLS